MTLYQKVTITLIMPLVAVIVLISGAGVMVLVGKWTYERAKSVVTRIVLLMIFLAYATVTAASLQVFVCREVDSVYYNALDYRLECFTRILIAIRDAALDYSCEWQ